MKRLPRKLRLGHYTVDIVLCSQSVLREEMDDDEGGLYHACWIPDLELGNKTHGRIFILETMSLRQKWAAFWHEAHHVLTDLEGWDKELHGGEA